MIIRQPPTPVLLSTQTASSPKPEQGGCNGLPHAIVCTSWDDGDPNDLRLAELLQARALPATFYVPLKGACGRQTLVASDLISICRSGFEIGGHSVSHLRLPGVRPHELDWEVGTCKGKLEDLLGREVTMFCYPNGDYNSRVIAAVKRAGYKGARTTHMFSIAKDVRPFEMPTTVQAFPHSAYRYLRNLGRSRQYARIWQYMTQLSRCRDWVQLGKYLFDVVLQQGGVWHIYGHSWEIDNLRIWGQAEDMLDYVSRREGVVYATNGKLLQILTSSRTQP